MGSARGQALLATPPGRCHLRPLANGPRRNPPYCSRSDGADTDTGGAPKPQRSGTSPALFAGSCHPAPPPLVPASQLTSPGASPCPAPLAVPPGPRHAPSAPAVCPCSGVLVSYVVRFVFFFFLPCPPPYPLAVAPPSSPFLWVGVGLGGGGGGVLAVRPTTQARRKHGAGTRHGTCPSAGGGGVAVWLPSSPYPSCGCTLGGPPVGACTARAPLGHGRVDRSALSSLCLPTLPRCPRGGGPPPATVIPPAPSPSPRCPRLFPWWAWEAGAGGGGRPRCPSSGVCTSQARHWHVARHLSFCWGVGHAAWPPCSPCPLCVRSPAPPPAGACSALASPGRGRAVRPAPSPRCPPIVPICPREGGPLSAPPFLHPPPLGGRRCVLGGGGLSFSLRCSRVAGTRRGSRPSAGGGGVCLAAPFVAPSTLRPHPRWFPRRGLHGARPLRARSCGSSRTLLPLPPHPAALPSGGGGRCSPPLPAFPALGEAVVLGGGGALFASPPLHARCRHDVGTTQPQGEALGCSRRGGGFPFGLSRPAPWYRPRTPGSPAAVAPSAVVATSPHGAQCPVPAPSCAHTYWRRYVPGWIRKMKKCGQRGGLTVSLEGFLRHPPPWSRGGPLFRHPTARGGPTAHPLPGACVSTCERPDTGAVVSVRWKWRLQSGRALSSPGPLPPPSAMDAPEVLWQRRGEADGGFICGIPWPPS